MRMLLLVVPGRAHLQLTFYHATRLAHAGHLRVTRITLLSVRADGCEAVTVVTRSCVQRAFVTAPMHIISQETELQLAAQMNVVLEPDLSTAYGGTVQLEQHVWKGISATFSLGGMWTPTRSGAPGHLDWSTNAGMTVHFDGF